MRRHMIFELRPAKESPLSFNRPPRRAGNWSSIPAKTLYRDYVSSDGSKAIVIARSTLPQIGEAVSGCRAGRLAETGFEPEPTPEETRRRFQRYIGLGKR